MSAGISPQTADLSDLSAVVSEAEAQVAADVPAAAGTKWGRLNGQCVRRGRRTPPGGKHQEVSRRWQPTSPAAAETKWGRLSG